MKRHLVGMLLLVLIGCDDAKPSVADAGICNDHTMQVPLESGIHREPGTVINWSTNPPATGEHYPIWARWNGTYIDPLLERGYWLHNAEHGAVVLLFNCPSGCPADVAALQALMDSLPADPKCTPPTRTRTLIAADPLLPAGVKIAAVSWGYTYTASCFDENSLRGFVTEHYAEGPEDTCADSSFQPTPVDAGL